MTLPSGHVSMMFPVNPLELSVPKSRPKAPCGAPPKENLELLKESFSVAYPITGTASFDGLLKAIDQADEEAASVSDKSPRIL